MEHNALVNLPDEMLHLTLCNGQARVLLCRTTNLTRKCANIHQPSSVALAAVSRLMTGTLMLSTMLKEEDSSVTVTIAGGGPAGKITCVGRHNLVKATLQNPQHEMPLKADGHLDVGGYIGKEGRLTVIKDIGLKEPYIGQSNLVSGEIGEDFAQYFTVSEQQPSLVAVGALVHEGYCLSSGGILVQPLPGCSEEVLQQLEIRSMFFSAISREVAEAPLDELYEGWFDGMEPVLLSREALDYRCDCSREKMERALISLGRTEFSRLIEEDGQVELTCHFCRTTQHFDKEELIALLKKATRA